MTSLRHVTIVGPLPPPAGGMANQTRKLAEFIRSEGIDVNIIQVNAPYIPSFVGKVPVLRAGARLIQYIFSLLKNLRKTDVVHIMANSGWSWHLFAAPAIWIANVLGKPVILNYRGGYAEAFFEKSWFWVKPSLTRCHQILVPSVFLQEVFADFKMSADIVPNVLDKDVFYPLETKASNQSPHIIVTRNLEDIYDVETAIRGFAGILSAYPAAKMSVAGTGPELANLQALVQDLNVEDKVAFVGRLSPTEIADLYRQATIMINTSIVDNSPNSIIEALACGTPVVTSNVGGIPKLVTHDFDAILVEPKSPKDVTQGLIKLLSDSEYYQRISQQGLRTISKFYWENVWQLLVSSYNNALVKEQK